jgi:ABC-type transport system involved in cytochrome bd biosynthesis fused ATPase/permease subunit
MLLLNTMKRILKPIIFVLAATYFLVDAAFMPLAQRVGRWIAEFRLFDRLRAWIGSLGPYPTLVLFVVPLVLLEPVKLVAVYLIGTGFFATGVALLATGEILKLVLVERLFSLSRDKLMSIQAFAWGYGKYRLLIDWVQATEAWRLARSLSRAAKQAVRGVARRLKVVFRNRAFSLGRWPSSRRQISAAENRPPAR